MLRVALQVPVAPLLKLAHRLQSRDGSARDPYRGIPASTGAGSFPTRRGLHTTAPLLHAGPLGPPARKRVMLHSSVQAEKVSSQRRAARCAGVEIPACAAYWP